MPSLAGWFKPGPQTVRGYCRSALEMRAFHYAPGVGTCACRGPGCELCAFLDTVTHGIVCVQIGPMRELKLLELRPRLHIAISMALEMGDDLVGRPVWAWRDMTEHGHPAEISFERPEHAPRTQSEAALDLKAVPCSRYIDSIGRREYRKAIGLLDQLRLAVEEKHSTARHA